MFFLLKGDEDVGFGVLKNKGSDFGLVVVYCVKLNVIDDFFFVMSGVFEKMRSIGFCVLEKIDFEDNRCGDIKEDVDDGMFFLLKFGDMYVVLYLMCGFCVCGCLNMKTS